MSDNKTIAIIACAICATWAISMCASAYKDAATQNKIAACYSADNKNCEPSIYTDKK